MSSSDAPALATGLHFDASYSRIHTGGGHIGSFNNNTGTITVLPAYPSKSPPARRCPPPSPNFVGRSRETALITYFFSGPRGRSDQQRVYLVQGIGGSGKTQLCRMHMMTVYAKFEERGKVHLVFYVDATSSASIEAGFVSIAKANGIGQSCEDALLWMSSLNEEFFIYMDNADDPAVNLRKYFSHSAHACILITTRRQDAKPYGTGRDSYLSLDSRALSTGEAVDLLLRTAHLPEVQASDAASITGTLVEQLYCHPLAIVQAGACIMKSNWTIQHYLERFQGLRTMFMDGKQDRVEAAAIDDYPLHVYTTWRLSYDRLTEDAQALLQHCAHFHHTGITEHMFCCAFESISTQELVAPSVPFSTEEQIECSSAQAFLSRFVVDGSWSEDKFQWCLQDAYSSSLLSFDNSSRVYSVHPLIHDCLRSATALSPHRPFLLVAAIRTMSDDQVGLLQLLPHVQHLLSNWTHGQWNNLHPQIANSLIDALLKAGLTAANTHDSQRLATLAATTYEETLGHDHQDTLNSQTNLAALFSKIEQPDKAVPILQDVIDRAQRVLGSDHPTTLAAMSELAGAFSQLDYPTKAEPIEREVLERRQHILGPDHPRTILAMAFLAGTLSNLSPARAEPMYREVLEKSGHILGVDHPDTITAMAELASTLCDLELPTEAEPMQRKVLEQRVRILGADHPDTITAMAELASTLCNNLERPTEAEPIQRQVLEKRASILGADHPDTITAIADLANTLCELERPTEAEPMERQVLEKRERILGVDHPSTLVAMADLAKTLCDHLERPTEAESMQRQVLEKRECILGEHHPDTIYAMADLANTLCELERPTEAETMQRKVLEKIECILGADHPSTITAMADIAYTLCNDLERPTEAETMQRQVLEKRERILGADHPHTITAMDDLADTLCELERPAEAESLRRKVLESYQTRFGPEDTRTIEAQDDLESTLAQIGDLQQEAESDGEYSNREDSGNEANSDGDAESYEESESSSASVPLIQREETPQPLLSAPTPLVKRAVPPIPRAAIPQLSSSSPSPTPSSSPPPNRPAPALPPRVTTPNPRSSLTPTPPLPPRKRPVPPVPPQATPSPIPSTSSGSSSKSVSPVNPSRPPVHPPAATRKVQMSFTSEKSSRRTRVATAFRSVIGEAGWRK